jgi:hypothetical protein
MSALKNAVSLFYQGMDINGHTVILNKSQVEYATQKVPNRAEVKMISGDLIVLAMSGGDFGDFIYQLTEVQHKDVDKVNP